MTRWLPRYVKAHALFSDEAGPDASGWTYQLEWRGIVIQLTFMRRRK